MQARKSLRRWTLAMVGGGALVLGAVVPQVGVAGASPQAPGQEGSTQAESPAGYATAAFEAWVDGNEDELRQRTQPAVAELLLARDPDEGQGTPEPLCEGAAGSTYCTFLLVDDTQLLLRVGNEAASMGEPHAVFEAAFITGPSTVAIWPVTTQEQADNTQQSVDEGHSPWMLDPATVITFYASAVLGWEEGIVDVAEGDHETPWILTNTETGLTVGVEVTRPARAGEGGIWAVSRAGVSEPLTTEPPGDGGGGDGGGGDGTPPPSDGSLGGPASPAPAVNTTPNFTG